MKLILVIISISLTISKVMLKSTKSNSYLDAMRCGQTDPLRWKILNGVPAPMHFPWFAAFYKVSKSTVRRSELSVDCGGALVTSRHVITAAHCYNQVPEGRRPSHYKVGFDLMNQCDGARREILVRQVIVHGLFQENWQLIPENDVAVAVLANDVINTPICLPTKPAYGEVYGITVGFGTISGDSQFPCQLMSANLLIYTREHCLKTNYIPETTAHRTVCAHSPGYRIDPCFADSGGPLMVYNNGRYELVGILSYGKECAGNNWPKIYTDITDAGQGRWLKEQIFGLISKRDFPKQG